MNHDKENKASNRTLAGGADFSLQVFAPGTEGGFYHTHKEHEELYFFLSGEGEYQVDGTNIPVKEGSVVRVAPAGKRAVRNTGSTPLTMLCIQYQSATPGSVTPADGTILAEPVKW
ncbi:MAG: cupin domain-containing protein [Kiritimatiellae bacterium]|nr:cupin domain-containing protein [Kiritimatiellia bacterium]